MSTSSRLVSTALCGLTMMSVGLLEFTGSTSIVSNAWAGDAQESGTLVYIIPADDVLGDGKTPVNFSVLALEADGSPMEGLKAKVSATGGAAGRLQEVGDGIYTFAYTPPTVKTQRAVEITLKGRTKDKVSVTATYPLNVLPSPSHQVSLSANPPELVLGQDASSSVTIQLEGSSGADFSSVDLALKASAGEVANVTHLGDGRFTALYTPPALNFPHVAIITAVDRQDPSRTYGHIALPLVGKTTYPVNTTPGASVMLKVGDREFGPFPADAGGRASVPILVRPEVEQAVLTTALGSETSQESIDLQVPPAKRLMLFPVHSALPADNRITVPIRVAVTTRGGQPAPSAQVNVTCSQGSISKPVHEGNGVFRVDFTPPTAQGLDEVTIAASLASEPNIQSDKTTLMLVPVRPDSMTLQAEPPSLPAGANAFKSLIKVTGPDSKGLADRKILLSANGAALRGSVKDLKGGDYQATFDITGSGPVEIAATVETPATGNPMRRLVVLPSRIRLPNDGLSSSMITVMALDEFGYPVAGVPVTLSMTTGEGSLPSSASTNEAGMAQVYYTAGRGAGVVTVQAKSGKRTAVASMLQAPLDVVPDMLLPRSGDAETLAVVGSWNSIVTSLFLDREGSDVAAAPPAQPETPVATGTTAATSLTALALSVEPASVAPGGSVTLKLKATDASGKGVSGQEIDFVVSAGTLGSLKDLGGGDYEAVLQVPEGLAGELKISAAAQDGAVAAFRKIPVAAAVPSAIWGAGDDTTPTGAAAQEPEATTDAQATPEVAPEAAATMTPTAAPAPMGTVEAGWLKVRAAMGTAGYRYGYNVNADTRTTILDADGNPKPYWRSLEASGDGSASQDDLAAPMAIPTLDIRAAGWVPSLPWVGLQVHYRSTWWGVDTDSFAQPSEGVDMSWVDSFFTAQLRGRYFYDHGQDRYWLALQGGTVTTALPVVVLWERPGTDGAGLWFFPWAFTSFYGGLAGGVELAAGLDVQAGYSLGWESYTGLFAKDLDLELSYRVAEHLTVNLGYNALSRKIAIPASNGRDDLVVVEDVRQGMYLGVGTVF